MCVLSERPHTVDIIGITKGVIIVKNNIKGKMIALAAVLTITMQCAGGTVFAVTQADTPATSVTATAASPAKVVTSARTGIKTGQKIQGFTVKEIRPFAYLNADMILMVHDKTGAEFLYIANDDTERSFSLNFHTIADDEKGKPHVFEHATLNGSDKYPTDIFFAAEYQTFNTFMNAITYPTQTVYPISSLSEAQLLKYADYYTDACFHPLILKDENIFKQEAWRYRLDSVDSDLSIEGTVYSEMLGAVDISTAALFGNYRAAFPGSTSSNVSGGLPEHIKALTYKDIQSYHAKYYRPSNCLAILYGKIDDLNSFAKLLNKEFSRYKKKKFTFEDKNYIPVNSPVTHYEAFPVTADTDPNGQTIIYRDYILRDISDEDLVKMDALTAVLSNSNSPIVKAISKKYPQATIQFAVDTYGPENLLEVFVTGINKKDSEKIISIIDRELTAMAKDGIDDSLAATAAKSSKISELLISEASNIGANLAPSIGLYYRNTGNIWMLNDFVDGSSNIEENNKNGDYTRLLNTYVVNNYLRVASITYPEPGLLEAQLADQAAELKAKQDSMTDKEKEDLVKATKEFDSRIEQQDEKLVAATVAKLKGVSLKDLPENVPTYTLEDDTDSKNIRTITTEADISGIGAANVYFDISDLSVEDAMWAKLYTSLMFTNDTSAHSASDLSQLSQNALYGYTSDVAIVSSKDQKSFTPYLDFSWYSLDEDTHDAFTYFYEALATTKTNQVSKIKGVLESQKLNILYSVSGFGSDLVSSGGFNSPDGSSNYEYSTSGIEYYAFLDKVLAQLEKDPASVSKKLGEVRGKLCNSNGMILTYGGDKAGIDTFKKESAAFSGKLTNAKKTPAKYTYAKLPEAIVSMSNANFNFQTIDYKDLGLEGISLEEQRELSVAASIITDVYLLPYLRNYYGAYGAGAGAVKDRGLLLYTYRDPNIAETYAVYDALADYLDSVEIDEATLEGYILSNYSSLLQSPGSLSGADNALWGRITGHDYSKELEKSLKALKNLTPENLNKLKAYFAKLARDGRICTIGSQQSIEENKQIFGSVASPFNQ